MIDNLVLNLAKQNILISVQDGEVIVNAPKGTLNGELVSMIRENKAKLIAYLTGEFIPGAANTVIERVAPDSSYPLSSSQRRFWVLGQFEDSSIAYNISKACTFGGVLDVAALEYAFNQLIARHETLRTVFRVNEDGMPRQVINSPEAVPFRMNVIDVRETPGKDEHVKQLVEMDAATPFSLSEGPLLRGTLIRTETLKWVFVCTLPHIISDMWSMDILVKELILVYNDAINGRQHTLSPLRIQYRDYVAWLELQLGEEALQIHKTYWQQQLNGVLPVLNMPGCKPRPVMKTYNGNTVERAIDGKLAAAFRALCMKEGTSLFMGLQTVLDILLYRYTGQEDIIIGCPVAGRGHADLEEQIGLYLNTLALRTQLHGEQTFSDVLKYVQRINLEAHEHDIYPFDKQLEDLSVQRDLSRSPLFDIFLDFHERAPVVGSGGDELGGLSVSGYAYEGHTVSKFDLTFYFTSSGDDLELLLEYNSDLYDEAYAFRLSSHLEGLLAAVTSSPATAIGELDYMDSGECSALLNFNTIAPNYEGYHAVTDLFDRQVALIPDHIAVRFGNVSVTYGELSARSARLAHYLRHDCGLAGGSLVGILLDRSADMIVALLGVLKAGCAYVPIDPGYPVSRKEYIISDTGVRVLLTQTDQLFALSFYNGTLYAMDLVAESGPFTGTADWSAPSGDDLAYVIYTSGSTGQPKGCMLTHYNLSSYIQWANSYYFSTLEAVGFSVYSSLSFDLTVTSIFCTLTLGGCLYVSGQYEPVDAILRASFMDPGINCMKLTPSHINLLAQLDLGDCSMSRVILGGEEVSPHHVSVLKALVPGCVVYNEYGPTEATVGCIVKELEGNGSPIQIGRPVYGSRVYILDSRHGLCPCGVPGEIYIGGKGVARGYLNQAALTTSRFIADRYVAGERMYRTGDLGLWESDGNIRFLGRADDQIKLRGYRIEPGEISQLLEAYAGVDQAFVMLWGSGDDKRLCAYVRGVPAADEATLRRYLEGLLPVYMVPAHFVYVESFPLTINGKIDRDRLPSPEGHASSTAVAYVPPGNETEEKLLMMCRELLGKEKIGMKDHFFNLGGHSLKAMQLISRINKEFGVNYQLGDLFLHPVLEDVSGNIIRMSANKEMKPADTIMPAPLQPDYPLSSSQFRIWLLSQQGSGSVAYNIPCVYTFENEPDAAALTFAFNEVIARHEILRTVFRENGRGEVRQVVLPAEAMPFYLAQTDLRNNTGVDEKLHVLLEEICHEPFDLSAGPLMRAALLHMPGNKCVFAFIMHHIISDGWSANVLIRELLLNYDAGKKGQTFMAEPLGIQYKDYAVWQQDKLKDAGFLAHRNYWLERLSGEVLQPKLSRREYPRNISYNGAGMSFIVTAPVTSQLLLLAEKYNGSLFTSLLLVVDLLLYKYTGNPRIILGTSVAGRDQYELEDQVGLYLNNLPLITNIEDDLTLEQLYQRIKETVTGAISHRDYPLDLLTEELEQLYPGKYGRGIFNTLIELHTGTVASNAAEKIADLGVAPYDRETTISIFDLSFDFRSTGNEIQGLITYNKDVFEEREVWLMKRRLLQLFENITTRNNEMLTVAEIDFILPGEKHVMSAPPLPTDVQELF